MNATKIALYLDIPRTTVTRKLDRVVECGMIVRNRNRYYLEPRRAASPPREILERYAKVLSRAFDALGPFLAEWATAARKRPESTLDRIHDLQPSAEPV